MNRALYEKRKSDRGSIAISVAVHIVVIALIASITFSYSFAPFFGDKATTPEQLHYITLQPRPSPNVGNGSKTKDVPKKALNPARLLAPTIIPTALPPLPPPTVSVGAISGTGTGSGGAPAGAATGVEPAMPDSRIALRPSAPLHLPMTIAERNDSAVKAIFQDFRDAEIATEEARGRSPKDWTIDRNGQKYGLDSQYIYLGKFKIPSAILAALPIKSGGVDGAALTRQRNADWIRDDIASHSQGMTEDDFRAAIKRIRERKDKEKKEADDKDKAQPKATPIIP
jgi:hypothetical protein